MTEIEQRLDRLLARPVTTPAAQALLKRYRKHRAYLLVLLHDPAVPHHHDAAERALHPSVVQRKVTGGFCSAWVRTPMLPSPKPVAPLSAPR